LRNLAEESLLAFGLKTENVVRSVTDGASVMQAAFL
jgi:hypothetical protein